MYQDRHGINKIIFKKKVKKAQSSLYFIKSCGSLQRCDKASKVIDCIFTLFHHVAEENIDKARN